MGLFRSVVANCCRPRCLCFTCTVVVVVCCFWTFLVASWVCLLAQYFLIFLLNSVWRCSDQVSVYFLVTASRDVMKVWFWHLKKVVISVSYGVLINTEPARSFSTFMSRIQWFTSADKTILKILWGVVIIYFWENKMFILY